MKGWLRWILIAAGALVALAMLAAGGLAYLVSRVDVRAEIERAVEGATGRELAIAGDVGVSFWPVLGLRAENASLANVQGGRAPSFLTAREIHLGVEIRPLFDRRIVVRQLVLDEPRIAMEVDAEGGPNWILSPPRPAPGPNPAPAPPRGPSTSAPPLDAASATLRAVRISDGEISYFDARGGTGWVVGEVDLTSALVSLDDPVRIEGSVVYAERDIDLEIEMGRPNALIRGQRMPFKIKIESELLNFDFNGEMVAASGEVAGIAETSGPNLRELASWAGAPLQAGVGLGPFAVSGRLEVGGGRYSFSNAGFALDRMRGRGDFEVTRSNGRPYLSGRLELFDFDLNPYISGEAPTGLTEGAPVIEPATSDDAPSPTADIAAVAAPPRAVDVQAAPSDAPIDFSGLRTLNADLELVTHVVLVQRMRIDRARLNLVLNDGYLAATLHELSLYGGSGRGRMEIDARTPDTRIVQDMFFSGVEARAFLTDAVNFSNIEGTAELSINVATHGATQSELIGAADGRIHLEVVSGVLHGLDMGGVSRTIRNALRGELIAPEAQTPFHGFSATFVVGDGVLASDNVSFTTPDLRIPGLAVIDVPQRRLDARFAPRSTGSFIVFPFAARGAFTSVEYSSDIGDRAQREIRSMIGVVRNNARAP
jgi:AsmA protein